MQIRTILLVLVGGLLLSLSQASAGSAGNEIHGQVLRGTVDGRGLEGIQILKTPIENLGMDTVYTDSSGSYAFTGLSGNQTYTIQLGTLPKYLSLDAVEGVNTHVGDSGQVSVSTVVNNTTMNVWLAGGSVSSNNLFMIASTGDTATYRSFTPADLIPMTNGKLPKPVKRGKGMPNASNLVWEVVTFGGFDPGASQSDAAGGMRVGIPFMVQTAPGKWKPDPVKAKQYSWVRVSKWDFKAELGKNFADIQTTLEDRTGTHTGKPRGLDSLFRQGIPKKPMFGQKKKLPPSTQNNKLFADLVALKVGIASSELEQTPYGFRDLVYNENNSLNGLTIAQIALRADSALTFWSSKSWDFDQLDAVISKINSSFHGGFTAADTVSFVAGDKLILTGVAPVYKMPFLSAPGGPPPKTVVQKVRPKLAVDAAPAEFVLQQNYPNPFNPTTTIGLELSQPAFITLRVFNIIGQQVMTLLNRERMEGGTQEVDVDAGVLPSGVYFYRMTVEDAATGQLQYQTMKKMVLLK